MDRDSSSDSDSDHEQKKKGGKKASMKDKFEGKYFNKELAEPIDVLAKSDDEYANYEEDGTYEDGLDATATKEQRKKKKETEEQMFEHDMAISDF